MTTGLVIGIVDDDRILTRPLIERFYDNVLNGYGVSTSSCTKYHNAMNYANADSEFLYFKQFNSIGRDDIITIILDLSGQESSNGLLKFIL